MEKKSAKRHVNTSDHEEEVHPRKTGLGFTTPEAEEKKRPGRKLGMSSGNNDHGGTSDGEGGRVLGKRLHNTVGRKIGGSDGISAFPPLKRKRGRPPKND